MKMKLSEAKVVTKAWGKEIWLQPENCPIAYKRIYINAGCKISLQYHEQKEEINYIISGTAKVFLHDKWQEMGADEFFHVKPGEIHRVEAVTDVILQEASTPHLDDVIRISDDYNRPNGHIESEHK